MRIDVKTKTVFFDQPASHYVDSLAPDDPRRYDCDICCVCGLLPEHHRDPRVASAWHSGYRKMHGHAVCSIRCLERFHEVEALLDAIYREPADD